MPKVSQFLEKITVISARSTYEKKFPGDVNEWKLHAFLDAKKEMELGAITNIICIGDSQAEIDAGHFLYKQFPLATIKTVKFKQEPTPEDL